MNLRRFPFERSGGGVLALTFVLHAADIATPGATHGAEQQPPQRGDALFPRGGHFDATAGTGVPFVAIGELSYGFGDSFALGAMVGVTPVTVGIGPRLRAKFDLDANNRLGVVVPALYYPTHPSPRVSPWILTRPVVLFEHRFAAGLRLGGGPGMILTLPVNELLPQDEDEIARSDSRYATESSQDATPSGLWETWVLTASLPAVFESTAFAEAGVVFHGADIAWDDWVGGPPVVVVLGLTKEL